MIILAVEKIKKPVFITTKEAFLVIFGGILFFIFNFVKGGVELHLHTTEHVLFSGTKLHYFVVTKNQIMLVSLYRNKTNSSFLGLMLPISDD